MTNTTVLLIYAFGRIRDAVHHAAKALSPEQLSARVGDGANFLGRLLWHLGRIQEDHVAKVTGSAQRWTADGWAERFDLTFEVAVTVCGHTSPDITRVTGIIRDRFIGYHDDVRDRAVRYFSTPLTSTSTVSSTTNGASRWRSPFDFSALSAMISTTWARRPSCAQCWIDARCAELSVGRRHSGLGPQRRSAGRNRLSPQAQRLAACGNVGRVETCQEFVPARVARDRHAQQLNPAGDQAIAMIGRTVCAADGNQAPRAELTSAFRPIARKHEAWSPRRCHCDIMFAWQVKPSPLYCPASSMQALQVKATAALFASAIANCRCSGAW